MGDKIVRRPNTIPTHRKKKSAKAANLSESDRLFLDLLKKQHLKKRYDYMRQWWGKFD